MTTNASTPGQLLKMWRQRRRLSQLALAADADISQRLLSFVESGRAHILERLTRQADSAADPALVDLAEELEGYPVPTGARPHLAAAHPPHAGLAVPLELALPDGRVLSMLSTTTVFGTPLDITLEELAIESFFPADAATQEALQQLDDT